MWLAGGTGVLPLQRGWHTGYHASMDANLSRLLRELDASAEALAREFENIDPVFDEVERRLQAMPLDVDGWVEDRPLSTRELSVSASSVAPRVVEQVGFGRLHPRPDAERQLLVRQAEYGPDPNAEPGDDYSLRRVLGSQRLADASREVRVAALSLLPQLIQRLTDVTRARTESIRQARSLMNLSEEGSSP